MISNPNAAQVCILLDISPSSSSATPVFVSVHFPSIVHLFSELEMDEHIHIFLCVVVNNENCHGCRTSSF